MNSDTLEIVRFHSGTQALGRHAPPLTHDALMAGLEKAEKSH
jgi:hypothetical protein